jgi:hypothetical protein
MHQSTNYVRSKQERLVYRLGNMTPLEISQNRDLGNCNYETKRVEYEKSVFHITKAIAEHYRTWDEQKIDARQKKLADIATGIWRINFRG